MLTLTIESTDGIHVYKNVIRIRGYGLTYLMVALDNGVEFNIHSNQFVSVHPTPVLKDETKKKK